MRIATVIAEMRTGGAQAIVVALARDALDGGDRVLLASAGGRLADGLAQDGAELASLPLEGRNAADLGRAASRLRHALAEFRPDLIHSHNVKATLVARLAGTGSRVPIVATLHGVPDTDYRTSARVLRRCSDRVVAVSDHVAARLCDGGFPFRRLDVVPNAIAPPALPARAIARHTLGLPEGAPVAVCLARLVPGKRHDLLVAAWRDLPADAVLLLAGDGPNRAAVAEAVSAAGLDGRVQQLGDCSDVGLLLAAADVAVLPTDGEGLPISVLEAMTAGVPVVASDVGGLRAVAGAAELVAPDSAAALAGGLARVLADGEHRRRLAAAGTRLIAARFALPLMLDRYRHVYRAALQRAARPVGHPS